jgi:hypothetical protein
LVSSLPHQRQGRVRVRARARSSETTTTTSHTRTTTLARAPTGVCTETCTSTAECGAAFTCVDRLNCAVDAGPCGECLPICGDAGACAAGSCQARTTVQGTTEAACDPCVPPADAGSGDAAPPTCAQAGPP